MSVSGLSTSRTHDLVAVAPAPHIHRQALAPLLVNQVHTTRRLLMVRLVRRNHMRPQSALILCPSETTAQVKA